MYTLSPSKSIKGSNYVEFLKDKNVLLCTRLYKHAPNLESLLTQQYVCVMCTLLSDNSCVFIRFHSVKSANTQLIWISADGLSSNAISSKLVDSVETFSQNSVNLYYSISTYIITLQTLIWIKRKRYLGLLQRNTIDGWFMVLNATFNNISVISWQSVLLVEETRVPGENHRPVAS
jgi:hypothetical protein